jgi:hypothetical protein
MVVLTRFAIIPSVLWNQNPPTTSKSPHSEAQKLTEAHQTTFYVVMERGPGWRHDGSGRTTRGGCQEDPKVPPISGRNQLHERAMLAHAALSKMATETGQAASKDAPQNVPQRKPLCLLQADQTLRHHSFGVLEPESTNN